MKTVSGKLISSKPVSLSKAAKILSGFAGHEHGASDAVSVYLNRAADAFNSLVSFHKELKNPHSYCKHRTPHVKIEENPEGGKVEIPESRGKSKKNVDFEVKIEEPLEAEVLKAGLAFEGKDEKDLKNKRKGKKDRKKKIKMEQISNEVAEKTEEKHIEEKVKIEDSMDIEQATPDQVGEERKKKKHKRGKMSHEEPIKIEQSPGRESGDKEMQVLDEGGKGKKSKLESAGIEQHANEIEEDSAKKREKKKRKMRDGEEAGESVELEERNSRDVDSGETIHLAEQSGMKKKKRRKTERED